MSQWKNTLWLTSWNTNVKLHLAYTAAECCARESIAETTTIPTARHLATALSQFLASGSNRWHSGPQYRPPLPTLLPSPVWRAVHLWLTDYCLAPDASCLVGCWLHMFLQCSLGWWDGIICSLLASEQVQSGIIHTGCFTRAVIHNHHKSLQFLHIILVDFSWLLR